MSKGEIKLKEHHDRGNKHNMLTGGEDSMMTGGAVWRLPSMTKVEIIGQIGSCHWCQWLELKNPHGCSKPKKWKIMNWHGSAMKIMNWNRSAMEEGRIAWKAINKNAHRNDQVSFRVLRRYVVLLVESCLIQSSVNIFSLQRMILIGCDLSHLERSCRVKVPSKSKWTKDWNL